MSDPAVGYGGATEYTTICFKDNGSSNTKDWTPIATATSADPEVLTIPVARGTVAEGGLTMIWCDVDIDSAQDYYLVKDKLISDNSRITSVIFDDANSDNVSGWIYNVNLIGVSPPDPNTTPTLTLFYTLIDEGSLDVSDPTSLASVGQGSVTNTLKFKITMDNQGDGEAISQVKITLNGTEDARWKTNLSFFEIEGIGKIFLSQMIESELSSTFTYKYNLGNDYSTANMIFIDKNGDTEVNAHVTIESNLDASNEAICVELEIRTVDAQGAFSTNSEDAEIAEGVVGDECTL